MAANIVLLTCGLTNVDAFCCSEKMSSASRVIPFKSADVLVLKRNTSVISLKTDFYQM